MLFICSQFLKHCVLVDVVKISLLDFMIPSVPSLLRCPVVQKSTVPKPPSFSALPFQGKQNCMSKWALTGSPSNCSMFCWQISRASGSTSTPITCGLPSRAAPMASLPCTDSGYSFWGKGWIPWPKSMLQQGPLHTPTSSPPNITGDQYSSHQVPMTGSDCNYSGTEVP